MSQSDNLRAILQKDYDVHEVIEPSTTLEALGLDSLDRIELVTQVEEDHGIYIEDDVVAGISTFDDLVKAVDSTIARRDAATAKLEQPQ